jgi:hypothetical protein
MEFRLHAPRSVYNAFLVPILAETVYLTHLDTFETFFDARFDLWERRLKKQGQKVMDSTREAFRKRGLDKDIDREIAKLKDTVSSMLLALGKPLTWRRTAVTARNSNASVEYCVALYQGRQNTGKGS